MQIGGFGRMDMFFVVYGFVVVIVLGAFVYVIGGQLLEWARNNASPVVTESVRVIAKRTEIGHTHSNGHSRRYTRYYVTFETDRGERIELGLKGPQFGVILEGDVGMLSYQGTRFLSFER